MKEIKKAVLPAINRENKGSKSSSNVKCRYVKSEAVRELERIADHAARLKYPEVPFLAPRKYRDDSANGLTKCIVAYIQLK